MALVTESICPHDTAHLMMILLEAVSVSLQVVKDLVTIFPVLRDWLADFLNTNCIMTASEIGHNLLIEQVL